MNKEKKQDWYFTFGCGQNPGLGYYVKIYGTATSAREEMVKRYGQKFAFQYGSADEAGVDKYNLKEVK